MSQPTDTMHIEGGRFTPSNGGRRKPSRSTNGNGASPEGAAASDAALARFYERDYHNMCRFAYLRVRDSTVAEDLVQQAAANTIAALRNGREIDGGNLKRWLYRCIENLAIDHRRRNPARNLFDSLREADDGSLPLTAPSACQRAQLNESWRHVARAVACLPPHLQRAFALAEVRGLNYEEIATTLGRSTHSVRQTLHRARRLVREIVVQENVAVLPD